MISQKKKNEIKSKGRLHRMNGPALRRLSVRRNQRVGFVVLLWGPDYIYLSWRLLRAPALVWRGRGILTSDFMSEAPKSLLLLIPSSSHWKTTFCSLLGLVTQPAAGSSCRVRHGYLLWQQGRQSSWRTCAQGVVPQLKVLFISLSSYSDIGSRFANSWGWFWANEGIQNLSLAICTSIAFYCRNPSFTMSVTI